MKITSGADQRDKIERPEFFFWHVLINRIRRTFLNFYITKMLNLS